MGTCKSCRWWCGPEDQAEPSFCSILGDYKHMQRRLGVADVLAHPAHALADHAFMFYCGPDFGCIHHEPLIVGTHDGRTVTNNAGEIATMAQEPINLGVCPIIVSDEPSAAEAGRWVQKQAEEALTPKAVSDNNSGG